ncbi:UNVERIFIED_ORG: hypothetical protein GGI57_001197 [Rhizobium aethiopicum]
MGFLVWQNGFLPFGSAAGEVQHYIAQGLFIYLFASTISMGYLATALLLEVE